MSGKDYPKLKNPPIAEAIVDWNGVVPTDWKMESAKEFLLPHLGKDFPHYQAKTVIEANVFFPPNSSPELTSTTPQEIFAHQFWNEKRTRLIQYRKNGFSFNMLPPYTTFEDEINAMEREWNRYLNLVPGFSFQELRLRFINRIPIPVNTEFLDWDEYFTIPKDTIGIPSGFQNFVKFNQSAWQDIAKNQAINRILFLENVVPKEQANVIFDIECIQTGVPKEVQWEWISSSLKEMRKLKNQIFFEGVTNTCLQLFQ